MSSSPNNQNKKVLLTQEGLEEIKSELQNLKEVERLNVAEKLKEAISFGDLSENSEYEDARNEQARIELRISDLEEILKNYELIDTTARKTGAKAIIGSFVSLSFADGREETYKIVGPTEVDIFENRISNESPIGSALLNHFKGDNVEWKGMEEAYSATILEIK
jgi:transcription elongation factor GreA